MQRGKGTLPTATLPTGALAGAIDLSSLKRPPAAPAGAPAAGPATVVDVTEATFATEVIERSRQVPVVLDFWAGWCEPCKQFSPVIEKLAGEGAGSWVLARIDVDANPRLATAAGVQGIPAVKAVVDGQIVAEFTGVIPEANLRQWVGALLDVVATARAQGGPAGEAGDVADPVEQIDPRVIEAEDALQRGDVEAAEAAFKALLAERPGDPMAASGLAQAGLLRRVAGVSDLHAAIATADASAHDVAAQLLAADVEFLSDDVERAFDRLLTVVSRGAGEEREAARTRLLSLFEVLPPDDPRVVGARRRLMSALF